MEFIKILNTNSREYHIFYDEDLKAFNYYCHMENKETDCLTLVYDKVKKFFNLSSEKEFKEKYEDIMHKALAQDDEIVDRILIVQSFEDGFWEDIILRRFNDCETTFVKTGDWLGK